MLNFFRHFDSLFVLVPSSLTKSSERIVFRLKAVTFEKFMLSQKKKWETYEIIFFRQKHAKSRYIANTARNVRQKQA